MVERASSWPGPAYLRSVAVGMLLLAAGCADPVIESTSIRQSTIDSEGPYEVQTVVLGAQPGDKVELFYNPVDNLSEHFIPLVMTGVDQDGRSSELYQRAIPPQQPGTTLRYYIAVDRDGERVAEDPVGGHLQPYEFEIESE